MRKLFDKLCSISFDKFPNLVPACVRVKIYGCEDLYMIKVCQDDQYYGCLDFDVEHGKTLNININLMLEAWPEVGPENKYCEIINWAYFRSYNDNCKIDGTLQFDRVELRVNRLFENKKTIFSLYAGMTFFLEKVKLDYYYMKYCGTNKFQTSFMERRKLEEFEARESEEVGPEKVLQEELLDEPENDSSESNSSCGDN